MDLITQEKALDVLAPHLAGFQDAMMDAWTKWQRDIQPTFQPTFQDCAQQSRLRHFDISCYQLFGTLIPKSLIASLLLLWYNPGLKDWYHPSYRMEAISGQKEHFRIQSLLLALRAFAFYKLSDSTIIAELTRQHLLASHGFMIVVMLLCQCFSARTITPIRWKLRGKIMPRPDEVAVRRPSPG